MLLQPHRAKQAVRSEFYKYQKKARCYLAVSYDLAGQQLKGYVHASFLLDRINFSTRYVSRAKRAFG